jgi:hypothetical protein
MIYPGSSPEFRIVIDLDGSQLFQVRYVNSAQGYVGKWQNVPVEKIEETND